MHFDYIVNETRTVRLSLSNLYKEFKNMNGTSLQLPLQLQSNKWHLVCVNIQNILETNKVFSSSQPQKFLLRSFQVCASVQVKGVYTSDIQYTVSSLPKAMGFKLNAGKDWFSEYGWLSIPQVELDHTTKT